MGIGDTFARSFESGWGTVDRVFAIIDDRKQREAAKVINKTVQDRVNAMQNDLALTSERFDALRTRQAAGDKGVSADELNAVGVELMVKSLQFAQNGSMIVNSALAEAGSNKYVAQALGPMAQSLASLSQAYSTTGQGIAEMGDRKAAEALAQAEQTEERGWRREDVAARQAGERADESYRAAMLDLEGRRVTDAEEDAAGMTDKERAEIDLKSREFFDQKYAAEIGTLDPEEDAAKIDQIRARADAERSAFMQQFESVSAGDESEPTPSEANAVTPEEDEQIEGARDEELVRTETERIRAARKTRFNRGPFILAGEGVADNPDADPKMYARAEAAEKEAEKNIRDARERMRKTKWSRTKRSEEAALKSPDVVTPGY